MTETETPRKDKKMKGRILSVRLTVPEYISAQKFANKVYMNISEVVREALKLYIAVSDNKEIDLALNCFIGHKIEELERINNLLETTVRSLKKKSYEKKSIMELIKEVKETIW